MCDLVTALNPGLSGLSGWGCSGGIPKYGGVCAWGGASCNSESLVTSIDILSQDLIGTIPTSIGIITSLKNLDFSHNSIGGTLPTSIGSLTALTYLTLDTNRISGTIPTSIGGLTSLTHLDFGNTRIKGSIPDIIGELKLLNYLVLSLNSMTGVMLSLLVTLLVCLPCLNYLLME